MLCLGLYLHSLRFVPLLGVALDYRVNITIPFKRLKHREKPIAVQD